MSLGTGLNIVQCRTRKTTKAGRGTPLPTENLEKTMLGDAFFLVGGGGGERRRGRRLAKRIFMKLPKITTSIQTILLFEI